jgi:hypothetical protein
VQTLTSASTPSSKCAALPCLPRPSLQDLSPEEYTYQLSPAEVSEIIAGTDAILARGVKDEEDIKKVRGRVYHTVCVFGGGGGATALHCLHGSHTCESSALDVLPVLPGGALHVDRLCESHL